jgi:phage terminase large subunit
MNQVDFNFECTEVFERNYDASARIVVNRGGTRSSKTVSLNQLWLIKSFEEHNKKILVTRKTFPSLRLSAMRDFTDMVYLSEVGHLFHHNRSFNYFRNKITGTEIHFHSSDNPQKVRSQKWDYIHLVEANELEYEIFRQYILRSPGQIFIDFNPSEEDIWINTEVEQKRNDVQVIQSSYLDNPYLEPEIIKEIEYLRDTDANYWQIYGLGEYGTVRHKVWTGWKFIDPVEYDRAPALDVFYGYDDGYVSPRALVELKWYNEILYIREKFYKSYTKVDECIEVMKQDKVDENNPIYCDTENPQARADMSSAGFAAYKANKKVKFGLGYVRRFKDVRVCTSSVNVKKEYNKYKYREDPNGKPMEEPVKFDDHLMDCVRYGVVSHLHHVFSV